MKSRGLFGLHGVVADAIAFRKMGSSLKCAIAAAIDYWRWDRSTWMGWTGKARKPGR
jgi:hypothetical protein